MPMLPDDWPAMRLALWTWVQSVVPGTAVIWGGQNGPSPSRPYVELLVLAPPAGDGTRDETRSRMLGSISIESVLPLVTYELEVAGEPISYASGASPIVGDIRDGLKASIEANAIAAAAYTVEVKGDELRIAPADTEAEIELSTIDGKLETDVIVEQSVLGNRTFTLALQVFAQQPDAGMAGHDQATQIAGAIHDAMVQWAADEAFEAAGLALVRREAARALPTIAGASWESRVVFDARFRARSLAISETPWIEVMELDGTASA